MLHRSFKPAKCKTALKLAASRVKLLKNKREAQVKQLKRELAQLLESGQDQTARIRVEHVLREEKTVAAYDLIEVYCELIVARLPIIESQKNCPIDLKEAIASVIFASPRCADIPELMDVRKHFTAKYGKEFVNGAVDLRPDCGVSRLLVEKLSAKAPDGPTKIKILSAIADEHNVKWDPQSFGEKESKPSEDLLNGPNTFEKASKMPMGSPYVQAPQPSYVQVPSNCNERHDVPSNFGERNVRSPQFLTDSGSSTTKWSGSCHPESRPTGSVNEGMEFRHSHSGNGNSFSPGRQNWNMEFKDATAAAQAAAESAERASMAARAAVELSSRGNTAWIYSAESPTDEETKKFANPTLPTENYAKGPINDALHRRNSRTNFEHIDSNQQDDVAGISENFHRDSFKSINKSSDSASFKSSTAPIHGSPLTNDLQMAGRYSQKKSENEQSESLGQVSVKKQSSNFEVKSMDKLQDFVNFKIVDDFEEVKIRRQFSHASSNPRSSTSIDDHNVVSRFGGDAGENPFVVNDKGTFRRNSNETSSYENAAVVFDDYGLDEDESRIDIEGKHKGDEYSLDFSSSSRKAPTHVYASTNAWTDGVYINESQGKSSSQSHFSMEHQTDPVFSECMTSSTFSRLDNMLPVNFDNSDGPSSESEEDLQKSKLDRNAETSKRTVYSRTSELMSYQLMDSSFADKGDVGFSKSLLQPSFDVNSVELHSDGNQGIRVNPRSSRKFGYGDVTTSQSSPRFRTSQLDFNDMDAVSYNNSLHERKHWPSQKTSSFSVGHEVKDNVPQLVEPMEDTEISKDSSPEGHSELNFENLMGGLRNKGYRCPPYTMSPSGNASSTKQTTEDASNKIKEPHSATFKVSLSPGATIQDPNNREVSSEADKKPSTTHFGSHDDDSDGELPQHSSTSSQEPYSKKSGIEENKRLSFRNQVGYLNSAVSDSEGDTSNRAFTSQLHKNTALSRRTKASPSNSKNTTVMTEASITPDYEEERNPPSTTWFGTETRPKALSQNKNSGRLGSFEQPRPAEQATYRSIPESKRLSSEESLKSSAKEQPCYSPKKVISGGSESLKASSSSLESPSKVQKPSHVHPKLPDYETLTAHLRSLRQNRQ